MAYQNESIKKEYLIEQYIHAVRSVEKVPKVEIIEWLYESMGASHPHGLIKEKVACYDKVLAVFDSIPFNKGAFARLVDKGDCVALSNAINAMCPITNEIHKTIEHDSYKLTKLLVDQRCDVNVVDEKGISAVKKAFKCKKYNTARALIEGGAIVDFKLKGMTRSKKRYFKDLIFSHSAMN
jgi:hypothetical protein